MQHQHYDLGQQPGGTVVEVAVDSQVNVRLMDESDYRTYCGRGGRYNFLGGRALKSPLRLAIPRPGHWHVAIDLGGGSGRFSAGVSVIK